MKLSHTSKLYAHLDAMSGYITAPLRETKNQRTDDGTRNAVSVKPTCRRRIVEFVNSQTVLCLLGYSNAKAFKIIVPYGADNYALLTDFITFVKANNPDLLTMMNDSDADEYTLTDFTQLALKMYASTRYNINLEKTGTSEMPYMVVVKG